MDLEIAGKRALVTGSSSGIGAAIARMLAAEGCEVMVHGRNESRAGAVARDIAAAGGLAHVALGDLAADAGVNAVTACIDSRWGGTLDILVNNSGGSAGSPVPWEDVSAETWVETYRMNVVGAARLISHVLPGMKQQGWGRLIQIGSAAGTQPVSVLPDYGAAKAAVNNMAVSLARTLAGTGITANTVTPGRILTPAVERSFAGRGGSKATLNLFQADGPDGEVPMGKPEDIAFAVCMIVSPRGGFITGANIRVDGGQLKSVN